MIYRQRRGNDTWHFRRECSNWPARGVDYREWEVQGEERPATGELCNECLAKGKAAEERRRG